MYSIVNVHGCVESHEDSNENANLPNNDPDQVRVFCDGEMPSFNAINYDARRLQYETEQKSGSSPVKSPEEPEALKPPTSQTPTVPKQRHQYQVSTREQLKNPIGKILEGNKKIVDMKLLVKNA